MFVSVSQCIAAKFSAANITAVGPHAPLHVHTTGRQEHLERVRGIFRAFKPQATRISQAHAQNPCTARAEVVYMWLKADQSIAIARSTSM